MGLTECLLFFLSEQNLWKFRLDFTLGMMEWINLPGQDRVLTTANALNDNFTTHLIWKVLLYSQKKPRYLSLTFYGHHNSKKYALIVNGHAELNYTKDNSVLIVFSYIKVISKNAIHAFLHLGTLTPVILKLLLWLPHWLLDTPAVTTSQICSHSNFFFVKKKKTENHLKCNTQQNHKVLRRIKAAASSSVEEQHGEQQLL